MDFYETYRKELESIIPNPAFVERMKRDIPLNTAEKNMEQKRKTWHHSDSLSDVAEKHSSIDASRYIIHDEYEQKASDNTSKKTSSPQGKKSFPWYTGVVAAACLILLAGIGISLAILANPAGQPGYTNIDGLFHNIPFEPENAGLSLPPDIITLPGSKLAHADETPMTITLEQGGYAFYDGFYPEGVYRTIVYFNFNFICQGAEGDRVSYLIDEENITMQAGENIYVDNEEHPWLQSLDFNPTDPVRGTLGVEVPYNEEQQKTFDTNSLAKSAIEVLDGSTLTITCYEKDEIIKEFSYAITCDFKDWQQKNVPWLSYTQGADGELEETEDEAQISVLYINLEKV